MTNKGQQGGIGALVTFGVGLVVGAIVLGMGARVLDTANDGLTGYALAAVDNGTIGLANMSTYLPTIGTVGAAIVIIGLLVGAFAFGRR